MVFCECDVKASDVAGAAEMIQKNKAYAFARDHRLREFWTEVRESPWMSRLGYDSLPGAGR